MLRTGAPWRDLPKQYSPYQTCHRRFQQWSEVGLVESALDACFVSATPAIIVGSQAIVSSQNKRSLVNTHSGGSGELLVVEFTSANTDDRCRVARLTHSLFG